MAGRAVVVGRSNIVGMPVALLLLERNATVTIVHSRTKDMTAHLKEADVVVVKLFDYSCAACRNTRSCSRMLGGPWRRMGDSLPSTCRNMAAEPNSPTWMLYGAYGYTGRLIAREAAAV